MNTKRKWVNYYHDRGLDPDLIRAYGRYIERLLYNSCPIIFELGHLAKLVGRTEQYLASALNKTSYHYRKFKIPKRRGGIREISAPYPALLECQQWINENILANIPIHNSAHAYIKTRSIISNATPHLGQKCLLHMDLKDFFPSIELAQVIKVFRNLGYSRNVAYYLSKLCCLDDVLPQGAATSPNLSNIVSYGLDVRLSGIAKSYDLRYTRYADDITFSGFYIPATFIGAVTEIVEEQGFRVNGNKTRLDYRGGKRIVTGLSVAGSSLKIPRLYKRKVRQEIYYIAKHGYISHVERKRIRNPFYIDSLFGKLNYWLLIEPDNSYANKVREVLKSLMLEHHSGDTIEPDEYE